MTRGEQHRRHRQDVLHPLGPERFQAIAQDRLGKFQVAVLQGQRPHPLAQGPSQLGKLGHRQAIATAVAADQQAEAASGRFAQQGKGVGIARSRMHGHMRLKRTLSLQNRPTTVGRITCHSQPGAETADPGAAAAQRDRGRLARPQSPFETAVAY